MQGVEVTPCRAAVKDWTPATHRCGYKSSARCRSAWMVHSKIHKAGFGIRLHPRAQTPSKTLIRQGGHGRCFSCSQQENSVDLDWLGVHYHINQYSEKGVESESHWYLILS